MAVFGRKYLDKLKVVIDRLLPKKKRPISIAEWYFSRVTWDHVRGNTVVPTCPEPLTTAEQYLLLAYEIITRDALTFAGLAIFAYMLFYL
jgi:hypothetical protein